MADNQERSGGHRRVERILTKMGISFISETTEFQPYKLDVYLPEWHLAIEIDGPQHSAKKDQVRDNVLSIAYAILTLHIKTKLWISNEKIQSMILAFIEENADTTAVRKERWSTVR